MTREARTATAGRSAQGTFASPGSRQCAASTGQTVSATSPIPAKNACRTELPPPAGSGFAATSMPPIAPEISAIRPGLAAGRSARPVTTSQKPTTRNVSDIAHGSLASGVASTLTVCLIQS